MWEGSEREVKEKKKKSDLNKQINQKLYLNSTFQTNQYAIQSAITSESNHWGKQKWIQHTNSNDMSS